MLTYTITQHADGWIVRNDRTRATVSWHLTRARAEAWINWIATQNGAPLLTGIGV